MTTSDVTPAICEGCGHDVRQANSCTVTHFDDMLGGPQGRIHYGREQ
jgi:hypothetical protein